MIWDKAPEPRAHWCVHYINRELHALGKNRKWLADKSGIAKSTLQDWWRGSIPNVAKLESVLEVFDLEMKLTTFKGTRK